MAQKTKTSEQAMRRGDSYECGVCGLSIVVDEVGNLIDAREIICCHEPMKKRRTRAKPSRREKGNEKVSAAELQVHLKGIDYPVNKQQLIDHAKSQGAPESVMSFLERFPDKEYTRPNEVSKEFGKLK